MADGKANALASVGNRVQGHNPLDDFPKWDGRNGVDEWRKLKRERDELLAALKSLVVESEFNELLFADQRPAGWKPIIIELARALIARTDKP